MKEKDDVLVDQVWREIVKGAREVNLLESMERLTKGPMSEMYLNTLVFAVATAVHPDLKFMKIADVLGYWYIRILWEKGYTPEFEKELIFTLRKAATHAREVDSWLKESTPKNEGEFRLEDDRIFESSFVASLVFEYFIYENNYGGERIDQAPGEISNLISSIAYHSTGRRLSRSQFDRSDFYNLVAAVAIQSYSLES